MKIFDENMNPISETDVDLSCGYLVNGTCIKADAAPIDNVTKFAWNNEDYEPCKVYIIPRKVQDAPTRLDRLEANVAYIAMMKDIKLPEVSG